MAVRRPPARRLLADGLGPHADDAPRGRPRGARDRGVERRVPARRAGGRRLARDARGRRGGRRPARRRRRRRRGAGRNLRPLGGRAPRALARRRGRRIPGGMPGAAPRVTPVAAVAQAGVCDLERGSARRPRRRRGRGAARVVRRRTGARDAAASPVALAPLGVPQLLVHGDADDIVPAVAEPRLRLARPRRRADRARGRRPLRGDRVAHTAWRVVVRPPPARCSASR